MFFSQFGSSEIDARLGFPVGQDRLWIEGIYDEDVNGQNPFGEGETVPGVTTRPNAPVLGHFWGHNSDFSRSYSDGLYPLGLIGLTAQ